MNILEGKDMVKTFGETKYDKTTVLKGTNIAMKEGEFVAIMGQSGSGKSTLLYNISGLDKLTNGDVIFMGENVTNYSEENFSKLRLNKMGFVFQNSYMLNNINIEDNIVLPAYKSGFESKQEIQKRSESLMKKLGIFHVAHHDIKKVSGGQLQRAAICRALINKPEILFADEPTGSLNSSSTTAVMDIFNNIHKEGTSIMLVTHDGKVAARADRVVYLVDGNIATECVLGTFQGGEEELKNREEKMSEFLHKTNF